MPTAGEESGAGGGGSGGVVALLSPSVTLEGRLDARGGSGGMNPCGANGGAGGLGRIRISVDPARCTIGAAAGIDPSLATGTCTPGPAADGRAYVSAWPD